MNTILLSVLLVLSTLKCFTTAQSGVDLDRPMLGGGGNRGPGAMLRFGCSQVVIERLDPLVNPGINPSPHNHQIVGGNAFKASMPVTDIAKLSSCTTCHFNEGMLAVNSLLIYWSLSADIAIDSSNYWTANLYFKARNGSYKRVPQTANQFNDGDNGGITLYYTSPAPNVTTAFKPGFRMLTGDSMRRTSENLGKQMQQCYRCFTEPNFGGSPFSPCLDPKGDTDYLPRQPCAGGIRSNIIFPLCWDGKNLDSPNHRDHIAHPIGGPTQFALVNGTCPISHPVKIPQLMYEVMWDTTSFNNKDDWPEDGSQPFILSTGDSTGYGQHGDYVFGWEGNSLQTAMDSACYLRNCTQPGQLTEQAPKIKNLCQVPVTVDEDVDGWLGHLPGGGIGS